MNDAPFSMLIISFTKLDWNEAFLITIFIERREC